MASRKRQPAKKPAPNKPAAKKTSAKRAAKPAKPAPRSAAKTIPSQSRESQPAARPGRPSSYTPEMGERVCALLIEGKSLRTICKADDMPAAVTVFKWLNDHAEFAKHYARARELQAEILAAETIEIADDADGDFVPGDNGVPAFNAEHVQRSKLRVDARKWYAAKLAPKKYGEKIGIGGADDLPPINAVQTLLSRIGKSSLPVVPKRGKAP